MEDVDFLTLTKNRGYIEKIISSYIDSKTPFSVVFLDLNNFKMINDIYGHLVGDNVLKEFTSFISKNLREKDTLGRFGGDEFLIIFPKTKKEGSFKIIERISNLLEKTLISSFKISFSYGMAEFPDDALTFKDLIEFADSNLYKNKFGKEEAEKRGILVSPIPLKLYGREKERKEIITMLSQAKDGKGSFVIITGEAGIGKNFLQENITSYAKSIGFKISYSYFAFKEEPFSFLRGVLDKTLLEKFNEKFTIFKNFEKLSDFENILFEVLVNVLEEESKKVPLFLAFSNLEKIDNTSFELLPQFLKRIENDRIFVFSIFNGLLEDKFFKLQKNASNLRLIQLSSLTYQATANIIYDIFEDFRVPPSFIERVYKESGGNPLLVKGILDALVRTEKIKKTNKGVEILEYEITSVNVKDVLESLLLSFDEKTEELLQFLSVLDEKAHSSIVAKIIETTSAVTNYEILLKNRIIKEEDEYVIFTSPLVREFIYNKISLVKKKIFHEKVAEIMKKTDEVFFQENIAEHLLLSGTPQEAIKYYKMAGQLKEENMFFLDAVFLYRKALSLTKRKEERFELLKKSALLFLKIDKATEALEIFNTIKTEFPGIDDFELLFGLAECYEIVDEYEKSRSIVKNLLSKSLKEEERSDVLCFFSWLEFVSGRLSDAEALLEEALKFKMSDLATMRYNNLKGILCLEKIMLKEAAHYFDIALELSKKHNIGKASIILNNIASLKAIAGNFEQAIKYLEEVVSVNKKLFNKYGEAIATYNLGDNYLTLADYDLALLYFNKSLEIDIEINNSLGCGYSYLDGGLARYGLKDFKNAERDIRKAVVVFKKLKAERMKKFSLIQLYSFYVKTNNLKKIEEVECKIEKETLQEDEYTLYLIKKAQKHLRFYEMDELDSISQKLTDFYDKNFEIEEKREYLETLSFLLKALDKEESEKYYNEAMIIKEEVLSKIENPILKAKYEAKSFEIT